MLRYESSALPAGQLTSLNDYASRMKAGSRNIYYLCAPNRHLAEHSPYFEAMKKKEMEVGEQCAMAMGTPRAATSMVRAPLDLGAEQGSEASDRPLSLLCLFPGSLCLCSDWLLQREARKDLSHALCRQIRTCADT